MKTAMLAQPPNDIGFVQTVRKTVLLLASATILALTVVGASSWSKGLHHAIEWVGIGLIVVCIVGRTWCSLYIGGRKTCELVTSGPYSVSRNPLYLFSVLGAAGVGAQLGAFSSAILAGLFAWVVFALVVLQEERLLLAAHGDTYFAYLARVPRFLPRLALWRDIDRIEVRPRIVVTTFLDACVFLAAIPIAEFFEHFQRNGTIHVLLHLR